ncbi:MAG TPA: hypothetical protein VGG34_05095 [Opitutaceae bacterium]|jgi:integrase
MGRKTSDWPRSITVSNVTVKLYRNAHTTNASGWAYVLAWKSAGGRLREKFADEDEAIRAARSKAEQLAIGREEGAQLTRSDRDELEIARALAGESTVKAALEEWAHARQVIGGPLLPAAEFWAARNRGGHKHIKIGELATVYLKAKTAAGIQTVRNHNHIFDELKADFGDRSLDGVGAAELGTWLARREHPSTRNTFRKQLVALWRWAQRQGNLPREVKTEAELTDRAAEAPLEIGIISPATYQKLLELFRAKHHEYLAPLVLAGFCGLRRGEIHAQRWEDIELERGHLRVSKGKRGTPARRIVTISDSAVAWLLLCADRKGDVCTNLAIDRIRNIARCAKITLPENCFRHSFVSYNVAATGNIAETALEAGNSVAVIHKHYRELVTKDEGAAWFGIRPGALANIEKFGAA